MIIPLVLYLLFLRQCIAVFAVAKGWLLLNIGWFVLFFGCSQATPATVHFGHRGILGYDKLVSFFIVPQGNIDTHMALDLKSVSHRKSKPYINDSFDLFVVAWLKYFGQFFCIKRQFFNSTSSLHKKKRSSSKSTFHLFNINLFYCI